MTGLLHRLGARATGTGWTVHSDARLPFHAGLLADGAPPPAESALPASIGTQADVNTPAATRRAAVHAAPHAATPFDAATRSDPPAPAPLRPVSARALSPSASRASGTEAAPAATAAPRPGQPASMAATSTMALPSMAPEMPRHAGAQRAQDGTSHPAAMREPAPLRPPLAAGSMPSSSRPASTPAHAGAPRNGAAASIRPLRATVSTSAWPAVAPVPAHAPTEVHIHIGRIDVTALPATPAPRSAKPARTEPMSLDSYLKTRRTP
jgi:hypothetical protein